MDAKLVNPFWHAARKTLEQETGKPVERDVLLLEQSNRLSDEVTVLLGVVGDPQGMALFGMSREAAKNLASIMLGGADVSNLDEMVISAVAELGNVIAGGAMVELERAGFSADIVPPSVLIGADAQISTLRIPRIGIPLDTAAGRITVYVALEKRVTRA